MSKLSDLDYVEFPNVNDDTSHVESSSEEMNEDNSSICRLSDDDKPPIFTSGTQFLHIPTNNPLPESCHLCAIPVKVDGENGDRYLQRHELVFRDVYLQSCGFGQYKGNKSLQIRGFNHIPKGIENIISNVNMVFLIDTKFKGLPSEFDASKLNELKGCWIERCNEMVSIFDEKELREKLNTRILLENLGISNNRELQHIYIYKGKEAFGIFDGLKSLYADSFPKLSTVIPSSSQCKFLKVLQIKHCDKIDSLSEAGCNLECLTTLHLCELPELVNISFSSPNLETLKIWECPKVKEVEGDFKICPSLTTLWITGATNLKRLDGISSLKLYTLIIESFQMLKHVTTSMSKVKIMEIRSCEKLQKLFTSSPKVNMPDLNKLHLEDLPMLETIGATFPSTLKPNIFDCPNL